MKINKLTGALGFMLLAGLAFAAIQFSSSSVVRAQANACGAMSENFGVATADSTTSSSLGNVASGKYFVWSRLKHKDAGDLKYKLSIDGDGGKLCNQDVSKSVTAKDSWQWAKSGATVTWSGGKMRIQMGGTREGVGLDCVVLVPEGQSAAFQTKYGNSGSVDGCNPSLVVDPEPPILSAACQKYDIDGDDNINGSDALLIIRNTNSNDKAKYDVDGDGLINGSDARIIIRNTNCGQTQ